MLTMLKIICSIKIWVELTNLKNKIQINFKILFKLKKLVNSNNNNSPLSLTIIATNNSNSMEIKKISLVKITPIIIIVII